VSQETEKRAFRFSSEAATCNYQSKHSNKGRGNPVKCLPKDTTSELAGLPSHYPFFMRNVKQESFEYQLLNSFGLTWPGNRTQASRFLVQK